MLFFIYDCVLDADLFITFYELKFAKIIIYSRIQVGIYKKKHSNYIFLIAEILQRPEQKAPQKKCVYHTKKYGINYSPVN
jgi:hypothetical protein